MAVRDAIASGLIRGPRLVVANRPITVTGGHCWFMGGECDGVDDVRRMVRLHHKMGADLIRVMVTGGFMTSGSAPWYPQFGPDELAAAVTEAYRLGKKLAAHAHGVEGIRAAVAAGVDTIEHCSFTTPRARYVADPELIDAIAEAGIHVCPTVNHRAPTLLACLPGRDVLLRTMYERGVRLVAGMDAGITNTPHNRYVGGLEALVHFGLPNAEVLVAATSRAAEAVGVESVTGQVRAGLDADLIAVDGDPLRDISALRRLRLVLSRGVPYAPELGPAGDGVPSADAIAASVPGGVGPAGGSTVAAHGARPPRADARG